MHGRLALVQAPLLARLQVGRKQSAGARGALVRFYAVWDKAHPDERLTCVNDVRQPMPRSEAALQHKAKSM